MKRIKAACITQTVLFSNHDGETTEFARKMPPAATAATITRQITI